MYFMKYICFKVPSFPKWPEDSFAAKCLGGIRGPKNPETTLENLFSLCLLSICGKIRKQNIKKSELPQAFRRFHIWGSWEPQNNRSFEISAAHFWTRRELGQ